MGYRSKVVFSVPEDAPRFEEIEDCFDQIIEKKNHRLYVADDIKWYDEFPVVTAVQEYLKQSTKSRFFEIGESNDHIEIIIGSESENPFDICLVRDIAYAS